MLMALSFLAGCALASWQCDQGIRELTEDNAAMFKLLQDQHMRLTPQFVYGEHGEIRGVRLPR